MENPVYIRSSDQVEDLHGTKSVSLPDIGMTTTKNKEENYKKPKDGAREGASNLCHARSSPTFVSLGIEDDNLQEDKIAQAQKDLEAYMKGAKAKVRASNGPHPKTFKRQRNDEKAKKNEERQSLKKGEAPPSFENPFYSDEVRRDKERTIPDPTYSTIPALRNVPPSLPPRPLRSSYEVLSVPLEIKEDDTYESLNFGNTDA